MFVDESNAGTRKLRRRRYFLANLWRSLGLVLLETITRIRRTAMQANPAVKEAVHTRVPPPFSRACNNKTRFSFSRRTAPLYYLDLSRARTPRPRTRILCYAYYCMRLLYMYKHAADIITRATTPLQQLATRRCSKFWLILFPLLSA